MRLATYNVENMFARARAMDVDTWGEGKPMLEDYRRLSELVQEPAYTDAVKSELLQIMKRHRGLVWFGRSKYIILRRIRGRFLGPKYKPATIVAGGRGSWIGWFELKEVPVKETATENTARVIGLVDADVLCVIEAEDRTTLKRFSEEVLPKVGVVPYAHVMLIDGNDERGIDVGIVAKRGYEITRMLSHVDDEDAQGVVFSRDCAEYEFKTPLGNTLLVLVNHFKSKGYGKPADSAARRLRQATRVRAIYDSYVAAGYDYVAIVGDLNETPNMPPMDPLVRQGSTLTDIMVHSKYTDNTQRPGTRGNGAKSDKLDYILLSPKLSDKVIRGGIERRGVWGGKNGTLFPHLETMGSKEDEASDHAALWVELDI